MKNYLSHIYFLFLKSTFFKRSFNPIHISFTEELSLFLIIKIIVILILIYNQYILYTIAFIIFGILLPDLILRLLKNKEYFYRHFINHINYKYKTNDFSYNPETMLMTYKNINLCLESGLKKKEPTLIIESKWSEENWKAECSTYIRDLQSPSIDVKAFNTIRFNKLNAQSYLKLEQLINHFMSNQNLAQFILTKLNK